MSLPVASIADSELFQKLAQWFSEHCDGEWEHGAGITIETLDNPGWSVKVNLIGTEWEKANFEPIKTDLRDDDWLICSSRDGFFEGFGDLSKLTTIVQQFLKFVGKL